MVDDDQWLDVARRPDRWLDTAERLERAAALMPQASLASLEEHRARLFNTGGPQAGTFINHNALPSLLLFPVRMTLLGQALENLVKGLVVAAQPGAVRSDGGRLVYVWGNKHLSRSLLEEDAGLELSQAERDVIDTLAEFVLWAGRFPAPSRAPQAEQRWNTELEPVYWRLSRRLRLDLKMRMRAEQRIEIERKLRSECAISDHDGVVVFEDVNAPTIPSLGVACECGSFFQLSPRYLAAVCFCGKLYHGRPMHVTTGGMRMDLDIYPLADARA
jgi:hypothetical protein